MADEHPVRRLQALDLRMDALRAERAALPERAVLAALAEEGATLRERRAAAEDTLATHQKQERALEAEVAEAASRAKGVEDDLYSGRATAPKELEALQTDLASCRARQHALEEEELALMEAIEATQEDLAGIDARGVEMASEVEAQEASLVSGEARLDGVLGELGKTRESLCAEVAPKLLAAYDKRRDNATLAGEILSALDGSDCGRCRVRLPVIEVTRLKEEGPEAFAACPSCRRLVLR